jgi:hypothetical protein
VQGVDPGLVFLAELEAVAQQPVHLMLLAAGPAHLKKQRPLQIIYIYKEVE